LGAVIFFALTPLLGPVIEALFSALPAWMSLLLLAGMGFWCFQAIVTTVIGRRAADHMIGSLAADLVRLSVKAAFLPLRLAWRLISR
jgi:hypothetical protein